MIMYGAVGCVGCGVQVASLGGGKSKNRKKHVTKKMGYCKWRNSGGGNWLSEIEQGEVNDRCRVAILSILYAVVAGLWIRDVIVS